MKEIILFSILGIISVATYFLPSIYARYLREVKHKNLRAIFILNLFGGWSIFLWVAAFIWAVYEPNIKVKLVK